MSVALATAEAVRLAECERVIERGLKTFVEVGRALMEEVRRWAHERGATAIAVGLAHTNDRARRFYERQGFNPFYIEMVLDLRSR